MSTTVPAGDGMAPSTGAPAASANSAGATGAVSGMLPARRDRSASGSRSGSPRSRSGSGGASRSRSPHRHGHGHRHRRHGKKQDGGGGGGGSRSRSRSGSKSRSPSGDRRRHRSSRRRHRRRSHSASRSRSGSSGRHRSRHHHRRRRDSRSRSPRRSPPRGRYGGGGGGGYGGGAGGGYRRRYDNYRGRRDDSGRYDKRGRRQKERSPSTESGKAEAHTRDARTIFVSQLVRRATERDIKKYFEQVGKVRRVELMTDRSGSSKGIAYVEFKELQSVPAACLLNGRAFCTKHTACTCSGFPILVKDSEAHKNHLYRAQKDAEAKMAAAAEGDPAAAATLGIGAVRSLPNTTPHPLMQMVNGMNPTAPHGMGPMAAAAAAAAAGTGGVGAHPAMQMAAGSGPMSGAYASVGTFDGTPIMCRVHVGNLANGTTEAEVRAAFSVFGTVTSVSMHMPPDRPTGFAFVHFASEASASAALKTGGTLELRGLPLRVSNVNEPMSAPATGAWELEDQENNGGGVVMNSAQRVALMRRLAGGRDADLAAVATGGGGVAGSGGAPAAPAAAPVPDALPPLNGPPSQAFIVRNMFNPAEETEANWDRDIREDVAEESRKYGDLVHIFVDKHSAGHVYMMFKTPAEGDRAAHSLHGRYFARRRLTCDFIPTDKYLQKFPDAGK